jgi:antitoxin component of MazEF toxin-antitoxin module
MPIGKSIAVTLPPYWLAVMSLEASDQVTVLPNKNNELVIKPYKPTTQKEVKEVEN